MTACRRLGRLLWPIGLTSIACLLAPWPALAARPADGGRYVGQTRDGLIDAAIQVSHDGRSLTSGNHGSYLLVDELAGDYSRRCPDTRRLPLVGNATPVKVDRTGRFSIFRRGHGLTLRVHGSFLSAYTARIAFRVRPARRFRCEPGPAVVKLHRKGVDLPFSGCRSQRARTLIQNDDARIFDQNRVFLHWYFLPVAYGCLYLVDERFELSPDIEDGGPTGDSESTDADDFQLAGPYTAFVASYFGAVVGSDDVEVVDLRDGRKVVPGHEGNRITNPELIGPRTVRSLVLKENGSVAWVQGEAGEEQVWAHDTLGDRKLDEIPALGAERPIRSLALTGSTLSWLHNGEERSAMLY